MTAIALKNDVRAIVRAKERASRISLATEAMTNVTRVVEQSWFDLSEPHRAVLRHLAQIMTNPPRLGFFGRLRFGWWAAQSNDGEMRAFVLAGERLKDALLIAVEREHPDYDAFLGGAVSGVNDTVLPVESGGTRDWLSSIRDSAC